MGSLFLTLREEMFRLPFSGTGAAEASTATSQFWARRKEVRVKVSTVILYLKCQGVYTPVSKQSLSSPPSPSTHRSSICGPTHPRSRSACTNAIFTTRQVTVGYFPALTPDGLAGDSWGSRFRRPLLEVQNFRVSWSVGLFLKHLSQAHTWHGEWDAEMSF